VAAALLALGYLVPLHELPWAGFLSAAVADRHHPDEGRAQHRYRF